MKEKFYWKTSFMVFLYAATLIAMMFFQDIIYIIGNYSDVLEHVKANGFLFNIC